MLSKLNLGCGPTWRNFPEFDGLDIIDYEQKYVCDVRKDLPGLETGNCFSEVMAHHFLEHFNQEELRDLFPKIHKVLTYGGLFKFIVPSKERQEAWVLSHKTFWNPFTVEWLVRPEADEVYGFGKWKIVELVTNDRNDIYACLEKI